MRVALTTITALLLAMGFALMTGCTEGTEVTMYKPGVYKGPKDPLVDKQRDPKQQEALLARFNQIQTDR